MLTNFANQLRIEREDENPNIAGFGNQIPVSYQTMRTTIKIKSNNSELIQMEVI